MNQNVTQSQSQSTGNVSGLIASLRSSTHQALDALKPSSRLYALMTAGLSIAAASNQNLQAQEAVTLMDNTGNLAQTTTPNPGGKANYQISTGSPSSVPVIESRLNGLGVALTNSTASEIVLETITVNVLTQCGESYVAWRSSEFADHIFSTSVNLIPGTPEGIAAWKARSTNSPVQTVLIPGHYTQGSAPSGQISFNSSQVEIDSTTIERNAGVLKITPWTITIRLDESQKLVIPSNSVSYLNLHVNTENYQGVRTTIKILDSETNSTAYYCDTSLGLQAINTDGFSGDAPGHSDLSIKVDGRTVAPVAQTAEVTSFKLINRPGGGMCLHLEGTNLTPTSLTNSYTLSNGTNISDLAPYHWTNFTIIQSGSGVVECVSTGEDSATPFQSSNGFFSLKKN
jgi:hypothetical protein